MNNFEKYVNSWFLSRYYNLKRTFYLQIHLTNSCQNQCAHCYFNELTSKKYEINYDKLIELINYCNRLSKKNRKLFRVDFTGGDPLLYSSIFQLCEYCISNSIDYGFKLNPDLIVLDWEKYEHILLNATDITLSLDGMKEFHDLNRKEGSFNLTLKALETLKNHNVCIRINYTISKKNTFDLTNLILFLLRCNFIIDDFTWARYWSKENKQDILNPLELYQVFDEQTKLMNYLFDCEDFYYKTNDYRVIPKIMFGFKEHQWFAYLANKKILSQETIYFLNNEKNSVNCTGTKNIFIVDNNLFIYNCRKINQDSFKIEKKELMTNGANKLLVPLLCNKCIYLNSCGGCPAINDIFPYIHDDDCCFYRRKE